MGHFDAYKRHYHFNLKWYNKNIHKEFYRFNTHSNDFTGMKIKIKFEQAPVRLIDSKHKTLLGCFLEAVQHNKRVSYISQYIRTTIIYRWHSSCLQKCPPVYLNNTIKDIFRINNLLHLNFMIIFCSIRRTSSEWSWFDQCRFHIHNPGNSQRFNMQRDHNDDHAGDWYPAR